MSFLGGSEMLTHAQIWKAIDALAARNGLSASGLARRAGLDPTTFNKSKRAATDGRLRWPSTESISKILDATQTELEVFITLIHTDRPPPSRAIPLINLGDVAGAFDAEGRPVGERWDEVAFPDLPLDPVFALEVSGDLMLPAYRDGDILVCSRTIPSRRGDRIIVRLQSGEIYVGVLKRKTINSIDLGAFRAIAPDRILPMNEVHWSARILWASQ